VRVKRLTGYVEPAQPVSDMLSKEKNALTVRAFVLVGTFSGK